jgi:hypothetical protein
MRQAFARLSSAALEEELNGIIAWFKGQASGTADSTAFSITIAHAQHAIEKKREALRQGQTGSHASITTVNSFCFKFAGGAH